MGGQTILAGTYTDPGELDSHLLDVDLSADGVYEFIGFPVAGGTFTFNIPINLAPGTHDVNVRIRDDDTDATSFMTTITVQEGGQTVQNARLFYNNSVHDGNGASVTAADFAAIDPTKAPLLFGGTATFANVSGYDKGLNGIFFEVPSLPNDGAGVTAADVMVMVGNDNFPDAWPAGPAPTAVGVLPNSGPGDADRIFVTFADGAVIDTWARLTIKANANTGIVVDQDFFFGSVPGDTGAAYLGQGMFFGRDAADLQSMIENVFNPAGADNPDDVTRDGVVNAFDFQVVPTFSEQSIGGAFHSNVIRAIMPQQGLAGLAIIGAETSGEASDQPTGALLPQSDPVGAIAPADQRVGKDSRGDGRDRAFATFGETDGDAYLGHGIVEDLARGRWTL
jgi:hypothetical protein